VQVQAYRRREQVGAKLLHVDHEGLDLSGRRFLGYPLSDRFPHWAPRLVAEGGDKLVGC
jgi:hypothetical protein